MSSAATVHRLGSAAVSAVPTRPVIFINGQPREDIEVVSVTTESPLDARSAALRLARSFAGWDRYAQAPVERLIGARVEIVYPVVLAGGDTKALPLMRGSIVTCESVLTGRRDDIELRAVRDWQTQLETALDDEIAAESITIQGLLEELNSRRQLHLTAELLPPAVRARGVNLSVLRLKTPGAILRRVLQDNALHIHCELHWTGSQIIERRSVRSQTTGRRVRLGLTQLANPAGAVQALRRGVDRSRPVKLVAETAGQLVESTFELVPGWDAAMEGLSDSEYAKSASADFDAVVNVHRLWVLNEDGAFTSPPFNRGQPLDAAGLFDEGRPIPPAPLRFEPALTRDEAGRSLGVVLEVSTDDGATWVRHAGAARLLTDRAGIYFEDDALPTAYISGPARVRVTATIRCPLALEQVRWRGNPFAGSFQELRLNVAELFSWRRVDSSSRYAAAVAAGERTADEVDDRAAMAQWLVDRSAEPVAARGEAVVETSGPAVGLRIGDRLDLIAGRRIGLASGGDVGASLVRIRHRFDGNRSELTWQLA